LYGRAENEKEEAIDGPDNAGATPVVTARRQEATALTAVANDQQSE